MIWVEMHKPLNKLLNRSKRYIKVTGGTFQFAAGISYIYEKKTLQQKTDNNISSEVTWHIKSREVMWHTDLAG